MNTVQDLDEASHVAWHRPSAGAWHPVAGGGSNAAAWQAAVRTGPPGGELLVLEAGEYPEGVP